MAVALKDTSASHLARLEEQRLIRSLKRGDQEAARTLLDHHKQRLFAFVWRLVKDHQDAEDICQEAFLKALSSIDTFDPTYRFSTWLFTIAYRLSLNYFRRKRKFVTGDFDMTGYADTTESPGTEVAESEEAGQLKTVVWNAVAKLSGPQQAAITLFYRESLSCQQIADVMSVPVATVKSHLHRARLKLKDMLEPVFAEDWSKLRILYEAIG